MTDYLRGEPLTANQKLDVFAQMHTILQKAIRETPIYGDGGHAVTCIIIEELRKWLEN